MKKTSFSFLILIQLLLTFNIGKSQTTTISDTVLTNTRISCGISPEYLKSLSVGSQPITPTSFASLTPDLFPASAIEHCGKFDIYYEDLRPAVIPIGFPGAPAAGFSAPAGLGTIRRNTLCAVLTYVQSVFDFSSVPAGAPIKLHVNQSLAPIVNPAPLSAGYLAFAGPTYINTGIPHLINGFVHDYVVSGTNPATSTQYHAELTTNFDQAFTTSGTPIPIVWHDDYTVPLGNCKYDLFTVMLHEIGHTLGFLSYINYDASTGLPASLIGFNQYSGMDAQLQKGTVSPIATLDPLITGAGLTLQINAISTIGANPNALSENDIWNTPFAAPNNHPIYSGATCLLWASAFAPKSVLSHLDDQLYLYSVRSRISPGDLQDYVMGPFGVHGIQRRRFTDIEISTFTNLNYLINTSYTGAASLPNLPPYSTRMAGYSAASFMSNTFPETVPADFPALVNNVGATLSFNLTTAADPTLIDPNGDPISVATGSIVNFRGCGNGGNNHNQLTVTTVGTVTTITYTPRPNFYGRAQFGFNLSDGSETGSFVIYTIDVLKGTNVNCASGTNMVLNGDLEEGTEVKQFGAGETINSSSSVVSDDFTREGKLRTGSHFSDCQPFSWMTIFSIPFACGNVIKDSHIKCTGAVYKSEAGYYNTNFLNPGSSWVNPLPSAGIGERYEFLGDIYNYNSLCSDVQPCQRYILEFDYFAKPASFASGTVMPLLVGFTNNPTCPAAAVLTSSFTNNITLTANSWTHVTIPFPYCGTTPASTLNLRQALGGGFLIDNLSLKEDLSPPPPLTVSITPASPSVCLGSSITLSATVTNAFCNTTYSWSPGGATTSSITVSPTVPTAYSVTVNDGCRIATTSTLVTILPLTTVIGTPSSSAVCPGTSIPATSLSSSPSGATFAWTNSNTSIGLAASGSGNVPTFIATNFGTTPITGTITITPTLSGTCGVPSSYTITVNPTPTITVNSPTICLGTSATLTATGGTTYLWSTGAVINPIIVSPSSTTSYTVTGTTSGCSSTAISTVTVTILPTITATASTTNVCTGDNVTLTATGAPLGSSVVWTPGGSGASISVTVSSTTTYFVTVTSSGCSATSSVTVTANPTCCSAPSGSTIVPASGATSAAYPSGFVGSQIAINGNFTVVPGAPFLMSSINDVRIAKDVKIIIQNGAVLTIDKCKLYTCSTFMWDGIEIQPGGMLIIQNNSRIEDAKVAVLSNNAGGIANFRLEGGTLFNRNYIGVKVINYASFSLHPGIIRNCTFDSQPWTTTGSIATLDSPYSTQTAEEGVDLFNVNFINIGDAAFPTYLNKFRYLRIGIHALGSKYFAYNNDFKNNFPTPSCLGSHGGPPCPTIGWAIWNQASTATIGGYAANQANTFKDLSNGILHESGEYLDVFNNSFTNITTPGLGSPVSIAIFTRNFTQGKNAIRIMDNTFKDLEIGTYHLNNYLTSYLVQTNTFKNFSNWAVRCVQNKNGSIDVNLNTLNEAASTSTYTGNIGIEVSNPTVYSLTISPSPVNINNNLIYKINQGITVTNINIPHIKDNTIAFKSSVSLPGFYYGIRTKICYKEDIFHNNVSKATNPTSSYENYVYAISVESNTGMASVLQNNVQRLGRGLRFYNDASGDLTVRCNIMQNNWAGLTFDIANIGAQGASAAMFPPNGDAADNYWYAIPSTMTGSVAVRGLGAFTTANFYTRTAGYTWCPPLADVNPGNTIRTVNSTIPLVGGLVNAAPTLCPNICYTCHSPTLIKIAKNLNPFNLVAGTQRFVMQEGVVKSVLADSIPIDTTTADGLYLKRYVDSTLINSEVGQLITVSTKYSTGDTTGARALNNGIYTSSCAADYHKIVNSIFLNTWGVGDFNLSSSDSTTLYNIAIKNPSDCGTAIYDARVMLGIDFNDFTGDGRMMEINPTDNSTAVEDIVGILYPNPASNSCTYEANLSVQESGFIMMYDLTGRLLQSFKLNAGDNKIEMDLSSFSNGIYMYKIIINGNAVDYKKLAIQK